MANGMTQTAIQDVPGWMRGPLKGMIATGENLAQEPYQPYEGPRIADFNQMQQQAFQGISGLPQMGQQTLDEAGDYMRQAGQQWTDVNQQDYINPYVEQALDPTAREIGETFDRTQNQIGQRAAQTGAFGGSRQGVLEGMNTENYMQEISDLYGQGYAQAYDRGQAAFDTDRQAAGRTGQGLQGLAQTGQGMYGQGLQQLLQAGGQQQALDQAHLDTAYSDFQEQRDYPYGQLSWLGSLIRGVPQVGTTYQEVERPSPSKNAQWLGAGISGLGLMNQLGGMT